VEELISQLFNVHSVSDVRQIKIRAAELLVPGLSLLDIEITIEKLKKYKLPSSDQIPADLIQAVDETLLKSIND
jgi:hypothetical protein